MKRLPEKDGPIKEEPKALSCFRYREGRIESDTNGDIEGHKKIPGLERPGI